MKIRFGALLACGSTILLMITAACGSAEDEQRAGAHGGTDQKTIKIGMPAKVEPYLPIILAQERGEFAKENLKVEFEVMSNNDSLTLLAQDRIQAATVGFPLPMLNAISQRVNLKFVFPGPSRGTGEKAGWWIRKELLGSDGVIQPAELYGKTLASPTGAAGTSPAALAQSMQEKDPSFDPTKVNQIRLTHNDGPTAVMRGSVDGAYVGAPMWVEVEKSGCCFFADGYPDWAGKAGSGIVFGPGLLKDRETGLAFLSAVARTMKSLEADYHSDPQVREAMKKLVGATDESIDATKSLKMPSDYSVDVESLLGLQKYWRTLEGAVTYSKDLTADQVFDGGFAEAIQRTS